MKSLLKKALSNIMPLRDFSLSDISEADNEILRSVEDFTMTSPERVFSTLEAVRYVIKSDVPGSIVECGVWRGGTMMAVARTLRMQHHYDKDLYLFDTYDGMPVPSEADVDFHGQDARREFLAKKRSNRSSDWCYASLGEVQQNIETIGYPKNKVHYVVGKVEETIPEQAPEQIAILRLDTDWYESTRHELIHLYPRLAVGGVLIIDDYGHWQGARKAVDEYFADSNIPILLTRIDYTGRMAVKLK